MAGRPPAKGDAGRPRPPSGSRRGASRGQTRPAGGGRNTRQPKEFIVRPSDQARVVSAPEAGVDLGHYLAENLPGSRSVRAIRRFLAEGKVTVNGQTETFGSRRLRKGDIVDMVGDASAAPTVDVFEARRLVFDDYGLVAYDKPPGLAVTPTESGKQWHLYKLLGDAVGEIHPVHRLDADTSGLVLFARTAALAEEVTGWFRDHRVAKTYHAIVRGHPRASGERRSYLVIQESQPGFEKWGSGRGADAREAITRWELVEHLGAYGSLVQVEPATGRHHQIRIHFSEIGHPLYGDRLYGDRRDPVPIARHALHASRLRCPNPNGGPDIVLRCQLPKDMKHLKRELEKLRQG